MKWIKLWKNIGSQNTEIIDNVDVYLLEGEKKIYLELKFDKDGKPFLIKQ